MSAQLMILPTGDAIRDNKDVFAELPQAGLPLMVLIHYLIELLMQGEPEAVSRDDLYAGWAWYLMDTNLLTERLATFMGRPVFGDAIYALYMSMQELQELMLTAPRQDGGFLSAVSHHGWAGQDLILSREITVFGRQS